MLHIKRRMARKCIKSMISKLLKNLSRKQNVLFFELRFEMNHNIKKNQNKTIKLTCLVRPPKYHISPIKTAPQPPAAYVPSPYSKLKSSSTFPEISSLSKFLKYLTHRKNRQSLVYCSIYMCSGSKHYKKNSD